MGGGAGHPGSLEDELVQGGVSADSICCPYRGAICVQTNIVKYDGVIFYLLYANKMTYMYIAPIILRRMSQVCVCLEGRLIPS